MAARHHYVSRFHLHQFCDPDSLPLQDPWLWLGTKVDGSVRRRSPKNVGTAPLLFDGPGGLADPSAKLENFLADEVEGPAAVVMKELCSRPSGALRELPQPLMRYLGWAASRSVGMKQLAADWAVEFGHVLSGPFVEPPPDGVGLGTTVSRATRLLHSAHGEVVISAGEDPVSLLDYGWAPDLRDRDNFLEFAHIQAYYFQVRWFPRLRWFTLRPPSGSFFTLGDRAVGWGVPDCLNAPPCCLRHPDAFLIAPLSRSLALVGRNRSEPWCVTPAQVNVMAATWARQWIVGPTKDTVAHALSDRVKNAQ